MRKVFISIAAALVLAATPAFAQGSGSSGDIGGAQTMGAGQQTSGAASTATSGDTMAPKKMKMKMKKSKKM